MADAKLVSIQGAKAEKKVNSGPFEEGEGVHLKSGGPLMTVESSGPEWTSCVWFDEVGNDMGPRQFKNGALKKYEPKPPVKRRRAYRRKTK